jgi:hypothetical protein
MKLRKLVSIDADRFFDSALSSKEMNELTGGKLKDDDLQSCGCHGCANLCCSGFGSGGGGVA